MRAPGEERGKITKPQYPSDDEVSPAAAEDTGPARAAGWDTGRGWSSLSALPTVAALVLMSPLSDVSTRGLAPLTCGLAVHYASSVQIPPLCAEAAGNAAAAEQRHHEDEHHHADNDGNKLADPEIGKLLRHT